MTFESEPGVVRVERLGALTCRLHSNDDSH